MKRLVRFVSAFANAGRGVWQVIKSERNMRIHLAAALLSLSLARWLELTAGQISLLIVVITQVVAMEQINTAVETMLSPPATQGEKTPWIGLVKDMAAGAVLVCALAAVAVAFLVYGPHAGRLTDVFIQVWYRRPWEPVLVLSVVCFLLVSAFVMDTDGGEGV